MKKMQIFLDQYNYTNGQVMAIEVKNYNNSLTKCKTYFKFEKYVIARYTTLTMLTEIHWL